MADAQAHGSARIRAFTKAFGVETTFGQWGLALFVGIVLRLYVVWANELDGGDWVARTIRAGEFVRGVAPIWAQTPWPEGNYLLPAIPIALGGDSYWSVRVFCALFAALAIPLICLIGRQFGGLQGGRTAAWILALLPFHIYISANGAMTEGPFLVCVLAAIASAVRWAENPSRTRWLVAAGLCVAAAEAFRFDGVFVGASIGLVALFVKDERRLVVRQPRILGAIALFGLVALVYPIALFLSWKHLYGDPLYMVKFAEENTAQFYSGGGHQRWPRWFYILYCLGFWPFVGPIFALTPLIWAVSWLGVWRARAHVKTWILVLPIIVLTAFYMRAALSYTLLNQIRYVT
ncbi:MAG: glycosyltransferase family 39 protein, partial [Longimicrobiales bacterium]